jgi:putative DNA primase/helicase
VAKISPGYVDPGWKDGLTPQEIADLNKRARGLGMRDWEHHLSSRNMPMPAPIVRRMSEVNAEKVEWLWDGRVAFGKLNLLVGFPDLGKSMVMIDLISRVTVGGTPPDGDRPMPSSRAIILSAEDGGADTIKPRLEAHGADCSRVYQVMGMPDGEGATREFSFKRDLASMERLIVEKDARLIVFDPLSAYIGTNVNTWSDSEMRGLLIPLAAMAERLRVAVVGIMHFTKAADRLAIHRVPGSVAMAAAPRVILAVVADPESEERRFLVPVKNNLGPKASTLAFSVTRGAVAWEPGPVAGVNVNVILAAKPGEPPAVVKAKEFLEEALADVPAGQWVPSKPIDERAKAAGISEATLSRAKAKLGIQAQAVRKGRVTTWMLGWPSENPSTRGGQESLESLKSQEGVRDSRDFKESKEFTPPSHLESQGVTLEPDGLEVCPGGPDCVCTDEHPFVVDDALLNAVIPPAEKVVSPGAGGQGLRCRHREADDH